MAKLIKLSVSVTKFLGDTFTPVGIYLRLRDRFPNTHLLESVDYQPNENCCTYICVGPIAEFRVQGQAITERLPGELPVKRNFNKPAEIFGALSSFTERFEVDSTSDLKLNNGFYGYLSYEALQFFEDLKLNAKEHPGSAIPAIFYQVFKFVIGINHYRNEIFILENHHQGMPVGPTKEDLYKALKQELSPAYPFELSSQGSSNFSDSEYMQMLKEIKKHIFRGDVFQIVPSRRFEQPFYGDEFNVYRALRRINPSPYLFYFDYGAFRLFGSSPEAELIVESGKASIHPIAGTCKRSGDSSDHDSIEQLRADPKENAEHVMLVDLARNDLSKHCDQVQVEAFKIIQQYSHVVHLVSKVSGSLRKGVHPLFLLGDTFPAGTLTGAPKYRAMELIDQYERGQRGYYGGAIGYLGFNGNLNHAIMIRTFLSKNGVLYRQAGGGIVADSVPEQELAEVNNKLGALKAALSLAGEF